MIVQLHLKNFRGFEDHVVPMRPLTIIVGRNNAGKSTIVEALRLVSIVVTRFKGDLGQIPTSRWNFPKNTRGPNPFKNLEINRDSIFHSYGEPPAIVRANFETGDTVEVTITDRDIFGRRGRWRAVRAQDRVSQVSILPQVAPVAREERLLTEEYVRSALSSALAPLHFRNQLHMLKDFFAVFCESAERTWPGLRIRELGTSGQLPDPVVLSLLVEDHHFTAEIGWMGHGLQMWLQMIWFLSRAKDHETVILDEPDVYMHADLQRRLVRFIRSRHRQVVMATHSSEIMAEVLPENILVIDRSKAQSAFASSLPAVQKVLSGFGSIHNLQLSRLWNARRFLMVEGEDIVLLKQFQNKLFPETTIPIDTIPSSSIGGWGGWNQAIGSDIVLRNAGGDGIVSYCMFDSDYFPIGSIESRYDEARKRGISLHIWQKKELENYLLVPNAIHRTVHDVIGAGAVEPTLRNIETMLDATCEDLKQDVTDCVATQIVAADKKLGLASANQKAREAVAARWTTMEDRLSIVPGKTVLSRVCGWVQNQFKVSVSGQLIANHINVTEVPYEMRTVLTALEEGLPFPERKGFPTA
jgi:hypothetical protein